MQADTKPKARRNREGIARAEGFVAACIETSVSKAFIA